MQEEVQYRQGRPEEIQLIQKVFDEYNPIFGLIVHLRALEEHTKKGEIFVAEKDGQLLGAVFWHKRLDGLTKLRAIAVGYRARGQGIGTKLFYLVPKPLEVSCPDGLEANTFYKQLGGTLVGMDKGPKTWVNIYRWEE